MKNKMNARVFIVTEGSANKGFGHITRCTSLYQAFKEKGVLPEFIVNGDESVKELLEGLNYKIFNWLKKSESLFNLLQTTDTVVIDSYLADHGFYRKISEMVKVFVCIDDTERLTYPKGIVINSSAIEEDSKYFEKEGVTYLFGSQYIPLRREFWEIPRKNIKEAIENVLITFGGDDIRNMTPKVLRTLINNFPEIIKNVVIGRGFRNIKEIKSVVDDRADLIYYPDAKEMKEAMLGSDIAISAGGQTLYELARVGVPTIAIAVADNQLNNIKGLQKAGFIEYAGWWEDKKIFENILNRLKLLRDKDARGRVSQAGKMIVDGNGARRVVSEIIKSCNG